MASGIWSENDKPTVPGFYNRYKTIAEKRIKAGANGVLAMPIRSNWGPIKKVVSIKTEKELINAFGSDMNYSAYRLGKLALLGHPRELLLYRLVDSTSKTANCTLKDSKGTDALLIETKYPTSKNFNVTLRTNIVDNTQKDIVLFENNKQLYVFSALNNNLEEIINSINTHWENDWITLKKVTDTDEELVNTSNEPLKNGNDGSANITNKEYLEAMEAFEGYKVDGFTLDGISDSFLHAAVKEWAYKNKVIGNDIIAFLGSSEKEKIKEINNKSKEFNFEGIVNVGTMGIYKGIKYTSAETACYIAALGIGKDFKQSICNEKTIFEDVQPRLKKEEIEECLKSGTLVMIKEDDEVIVVDDVNTFKKYTDDKSKVLGNIRAIKFISMVNRDTSLKKSDFLGKVSNDDTGRTIVICALKQYFEVFAKEHIIDKDFTVEIDKKLQATAETDELFWLWDAKYIDVIKRIYGTGYIRE